MYVFLFVIRSFLSSIYLFLCEFFTYISLSYMKFYFQPTKNRGITQPLPLCSMYFLYFLSFFIRNLAERKCLAFPLCGFKPHGEKETLDLSSKLEVYSFPSVLHSEPGREKMLCISSLWFQTTW